MGNSYTENDLLLYLYQEMPAEEAQKLEACIQVSPALQQSLSNLKAGMAAVKKLETETSQTSVDLILEYAQQSAVNLEKV